MGKNLIRVFFTPPTSGQKSCLKCVKGFKRGDVWAYMPNSVLKVHRGCMK